MCNDSRNRSPCLILASTSPRRRELLEKIGLEFEVVESDGKHEVTGTGDPCTLAKESALGKARVAAARRPDALVLSADTMVWLDGQSLGKPADERQAAWMLARLSGRTHTVHTGVALVGPGGPAGEIQVACVDTAVRFRELSDDLIARYVATGEPFDKAGGYGIQGRGAVLVESICGCYYNVVGLPVSKVAQMLEPYGILIP